MPARKVDRDKPEGFLPTASLILAIVRAKPGISLKGLAGAIWPGLAWAPATPGQDSATVRLRAWPGCTTRTSAALWLLDLTADLALGGFLRHGPRALEVDRLASITFVAVADVAAERIHNA